MPTAFFRLSSFDWLWFDDCETGSRRCGPVRWWFITDPMVTHSTTDQSQQSTSQSTGWSSIHPSIHFRAIWNQPRSIDPGDMNPGSDSCQLDGSTRAALSPNSRNDYIELSPKVEMMPRLIRPVADVMGVMMTQRFITTRHAFDIESFPPFLSPFTIWNYLVEAPTSLRKCYAS